jgi:virulence-associated protein VagC
MSTGSIIENNRMQAVLLPFETRFPSNVKKSWFACVEMSAF